eukprot:1741712-Rhodomonas_salina.1
MEVRGLSHCNINGLRCLAPHALFHGHTAICDARQVLIAEAHKHQLFLELPHRYGTDLGPVLHLAFQRWRTENPDHELAKQEDWCAKISFKIKLDAREVYSNPKLDHTEIMVVLLIPGTEEDNDSQHPAYHYTLAVYEGKDDTENIKANFGYLAEQMVNVMLEGLTFGNLHLDVDIFMPCNMKAHWAILACCRIHDKGEQ